MANPRVKAVYVMDDGEQIVIKVPYKYFALGSFTAPANGTTYATRPAGLRLRHCNLMTHVPDSAAGANDAHFLERKVPCNAAALQAANPLHLGATVNNLDGPNDTLVYHVNGWTGERKKNL